MIGMHRANTHTLGDENFKYGGHKSMYGISGNEKNKNGENAKKSGTGNKIMANTKQKSPCHCQNKIYKLKD